MSAESEISRAFAELKDAFKETTKGDYVLATNSVVNALHRAARATAAGADLDDVNPLFIAAQTLLRYIGEISHEAGRAARAIDEAKEFAERGLNDPFFTTKQNPRRR